MTVKIQVKKPLAHTIKIAAATIAVFACVALLTRFFGAHDNENAQHQSSQWHVCFSPGGGCTDAIVQKLAEAKSTVFVQAYSFTSEPIAQALVDAKKRGVTVSVVLDASQQSEPNGKANFLSHADIRTLIDGAHAINHNKVMIIDNETVITGSFNFTIAAEEKNAENLLIIQDKTLAQRFTENWYVHAAHSKPLP
jgi:phosphatidylserine/phosphatidylglycerophosphate/cardiolipin synthase-like enzyme